MENIAMNSAHDSAVVFHGALIDSPTHPDATAMLVVDGTIRWLGAQADAPLAGARVVDLSEYAGTTVVLPAFVDAHVHATATGLALTGLNLAECGSAAALLERVAASAKQANGGVIIGHGWDPSAWPAGDSVRPGELGGTVSPGELDRAAGGLPVYLARVDVHSALASSRLRDMVADLVSLPGYSAAGPLTRDAHHAVRDVALSSISASQREAAQRAMLRHAASLGIGSVHECGGPLIAGEGDFTGLLRLAQQEHGVEVYGLWGEADPVKAHELGAVVAGGDLFIDGSLGSATAHVREPYCDGGHGFGYLDADQIAEHVVSCLEHRIPAGFHAIGDAALATLVDGYAKAASVVELMTLRAGRHRVEHAHMLDALLIRGLVEYGLTASVQPTFDALWGGPTGMYADRLGAQRAAGVMPLAALNGTGVPMAFGSDAPAGPMGPWRAIRAAVHPHNADHALTPRTAFAAHTRGGWRAIGHDNAGVLAPGNPASFAVWSAPNAWGDRFELNTVVDFLKVATLEPDTVDPIWRTTVVHGRDVEVSADDQQAGVATRAGGGG